MYLRQVKNGWRCEIERRGVKRSRTFSTKAEASAWGTREEAAILAGARGEYPARTLSEAIDRYIGEVTRHRRTKRADILRFEAWRRDFPGLAAKVLHEITPADLGAWRDARLAKVSGASVLREAQQFRPIWTLAITEWKWAGSSPWKGLRLPAKKHARTRLAARDETRAILRAGGYRRGVPPAGPKQQAVWAFMVALHTAMRSGEILRMARSNVDLRRRVYRLDQHKTDSHVGQRLVPFTPRAARVLAVLDAAAAAAGRDRYFTISDASRDRLFRKVLGHLMIEGFRFHDSRASALTRLSRKYEVQVLARISGHTDISQLHKTYYRETAEDVAARL